MEDPAVELSTEISLDELRLLESTYEKEIASAGVASNETLFNYAWGLVQSQFDDDRKRGLLLLKEVLNRGEKERQMDCWYYLAIGYFKQGNFYEAKLWNDRILEVSPAHPQGKALQRLIKDKLARDGLIGMALVGVGAVAVGGLAYLMRRR